MLFRSSLGGWSRQIQTEFHVLRPTQDTANEMSKYGYRAITVYGRPFQTCSPYQTKRICRGPTTPTAPERHRFGLFPGRSPLLGESLLFSFPTGTKMFQFPAFASPKGDDGHSARRVIPFGYLRVKGYLHLTRAFRSLSRPSSPPRA